MMKEFLIENLHFKKLKEEDIATIKSWLMKDHIKEYWGDGGLTIPDLEKFVRYQPSIFCHYFGFYNGNPIVYFMKSFLEEGHSWDCWKEAGENLSLDVMIGDNAFIGKGLAHKMIEKFIVDECKGAAAVLIDPDAVNKKAIRVYEKAGFKSQGIYCPEKGQWAGIEHLIMKKVLKCD